MAINIFRATDQPVQPAQQETPMQQPQPQQQYTQQPGALPPQQPPGATPWPQPPGFAGAPQQAYQAPAPQQAYQAPAPQQAYQQPAPQQAPQQWQQPPGGYVPDNAALTQAVQTVVETTAETPPPGAGRKRGGRKPKVNAAAPAPGPVGAGEQIAASNEGEIVDEDPFGVDEERPSKSHTLLTDITNLAGRFEMLGLRLNWSITPAE
jgi:hypothetical protein